MATGAQCCCLVSLGPCKHRDAGLHSGKVGRDTPPLTESPLSPLLFPHNSAPLIPTAPNSIHPFRPWGWHSPDLQLHWPGFQNAMILLRQGPGGSLRDIWSYIIWGPSTYVCGWKPPGAQETDIWSLPSQTSEIFVILSPNLWTEPSGWRVPSMIVLFILLSWFLNYAHSSLNRNPVLLPSHKLMG